MALRICLKIDQDSERCLDRKCELVFDKTKIPFYFQGLFPIPHDGSALPIGSKMVCSIECEYKGQDGHGKERAFENLFVAFQFQDLIYSDQQLRLLVEKRIPTPVNLRLLGNCQKRVRVEASRSGL